MNINIRIERMYIVYPFRKIISHISTYIKGLSIRRKISIGYILLVIVQTIILTYCANAYISNALIKDSLNRMNSESNLVINNIDNIMNNVESYSNDLTVMLNNYFITGSKANETGIYTNDDKNMLIEKAFRNALYVYHQMYGLMYISNSGKIITSDNLLSSGNYKDITNLLLRNAQKYNCVWLKMSRNNFADGSEIVIPYCKRIVNINTGEYIGFLTLIIDENTFSDVYSNIDGYASAEYFFCDKDGVIVSSEHKENIFKPVTDAKLRNWIVKGRSDHIVTSVNGKNMLVTKTSFSKVGWQLICAVPMGDITAGSRKMTVLILLLGAAFLVLSAAASKIISLSITRPLYRLIHDVQNLRLDNLDDVSEIESGDDLGKLSKSLNLMKKRIVELIESNREHEQKQRKIELNLLQAQIKPHFFYNTLQLVYVMIEMGSKEIAQKAVRALADFYRTVLNNGNEIVTMEKELSNTEDYLCIQKIRYSDTFDYTIECNQELLKYKILKLTLQPIVENAISHGIAAKSDNGGIIRIKVEKEDDILNVRISDNGVGMSQEQIADIFKNKDGNQSESFGLKNIDERIKLYFGYSYGLKINSRESEGTTVNIYIPAIELSGDEGVL